ncbi:MAG: hypothetical protein KDB07_04335 [Planctomycetes bacterium]|nr:hypothetical protein [Planctomycetota bacterium]
MNRTTRRALVDQLEKCAMTYAFIDELAKLAEVAPKNLEQQMLMGIDKVRPYAYRAAMGAVPGAVLGNIFGGRKGGLVGAGLGAGVGLTDRYLEDMSAKDRTMGKLLTSYKTSLS